MLALNLSSTYPGEYAPACFSAAALLDSLFEQPAEHSEPAREGRGHVPRNSQVGGKSLQHGLGVSSDGKFFVVAPHMSDDGANR